MILLGGEPYYNTVPKKIKLPAKLFYFAGRNEKGRKRSGRKILRNDAHELLVLGQTEHNEALAFVHVVVHMLAEKSILAPQLRLEVDGIFTAEKSEAAGLRAAVLIRPYSTVCAVSRRTITRLSVKA